MQVWELLHAARWKHRMQKSRQKSPYGHHRTNLSGYIFATKSRIDNRKKNLLSSDMYSTCPHNMVNFGLLTAEIHPVVWGTPANFNGFRVWQHYCMASSRLVVGVSQLCGVEQRAPPVFGRANITLGIGPHSSLLYFWTVLYKVRL